MCRVPLWILCWWAENGFQETPEDMARMLYEMTYQEALPTEDSPD